MNMSLREQHEVISIIMAAVAGDASDEQLARLNRLMLEDEDWSRLLLRLMSQEAWLAWHGSKAQPEWQIAAIGDGIDGSMAGYELAIPAEQKLERLEQSISRAIAEMPSARLAQAVRPQQTWTAAVKRFWSVPTMAAALLLGIGALLGGAATFWMSTDHALIAKNGTSDPQSAQKPLLALYEAKLMHGTACVWAPEMRSRLTSHDTLQSGDSLNLIAGLAEIELSWPMRGNAVLRLEGPAGLVMMADGGTSLNYGKLTADVLLRYDSFTVDTPIGRVVATDNTHFGVAVSSGTVEVHVFSGQAEINTSWISGAEAPEKLRIRSGRSIRLSAKDSGAIDIARGPALYSRFASQMSMGSAQLEISDEYVNAIKEAKPLVYWRFDTPGTDLVKNEMSDRYNARIFGKPSWVDERGNMSIEFGAGLNADELRAFLVSETPLENVESKTYTIELWAKPSHYHLGTMVGLVGAEGNEKIAKGAHGVLVELGGLPAFYSSIEHPGRVRFLHRNPPSHDPNSGTSAFSSEPYMLRSWQHIVAVKDEKEMRLYVDGKLMASFADDTNLSNGLELLIGQMDRERDWRPFVGQLDELAFYTRALSVDEINQHHQLARPKRAPRREI